LRCKFCQAAEEIKQLKAQISRASDGLSKTETVSSNGLSMTETVNTDPRLLAVELKLENVLKQFHEFKDLISSEIAAIKETVETTQNQVKELQVHLDSEFAKKVSALDAETNDRIKAIENSVKDSEALYTTVASRRQPRCDNATHVGPQSYHFRPNTRNRFDVLPDEMDSQNTEEIIVIGDYNVTSFKSNQRKGRIQLKILGKADLKIDEVEGIIAKERIHSSKRIIIQVGAKDVSQTESTWKRYEAMLNNIKPSYANLHVTGILPHPNQSRYKLSKMILLNNRLATFCKAQKISFSDHWDTMIDPKYYNFNRITNKARITTYGLDTIENILKNIGVGLVNENKSKNENDIIPTTPPAVPDKTTQRPPPVPTRDTQQIQVPIKTPPQVLAQKFLLSIQPELEAVVAASQVQPTKTKVSAPTQDLRVEAK
jgi:hypothetical protein